MDGRNEVETVGWKGKTYLYYVHLTESETQHYQLRHTGNRIGYSVDIDSDFDVFMDEERKLK